MEIKVSFVLPTYNRVNFLAECIESLRKQTMKEIEIIVVDDCSTDTTVSLMKWYCGQDSRIKYFRNKKNIGAGLSRNVGNKIATGEIICVCDSDDFYPNNRAIEAYKYFQKNPKTDIINYSYHRVSYSNEVEGKFEAKSPTPEEAKKTEQVFFCHPSSAYRREDILKMPYKKETKEKTDDYQLITDWLDAGKKLVGISKTMCFHRVLPGSIMCNKRGGSLD